jgi:hypothetical protein
MRGRCLIRQRPRMSFHAISGVVTRAGCSGGIQTTVSVTSMLPRVAFEYGHTLCAAATRASAASRSKPGSVIFIATWMPKPPGMGPMPTSPGSILRGRIQLFRYFLLVVVCVYLNYIFIKLFVEYFSIYPTISKILTTVIVVSFSYFTQKYFTFKTGSDSEQG